MVYEGIAGLQNISKISRFSQFENLEDLAKHFNGQTLETASDDLLNAGWNKVGKDFKSKTVFEKQLGKDKFYAIWEPSNLEHTADGKPASYWKITRGRISGSKGNVIRIGSSSNFIDK